MNRSSTGWPELPIAPAKARIAVRRVCAAEPVTREWFASRGYELSDFEWRSIEDWIDSVPRSRVAERHSSDDGTVRLLVDLGDDRVETVVMPVGAVCVSTQIGCAVGCRFCASGLDGLARNLSATEIVEQLIHARRERRVDRVVYMGMGEPTHNLTAVLDAVARMHRDAHIGPRRQTLSTVGATRVFDRLGEADVQPCLALSLHTTCAEKRRELLPRAYHDDSIESLVDGADAYGQRMGMPVQYEWTLLDGINDGDDELERLIELLEGRAGYVNFILWNEVDGLPFARPSRERAIAMVRALRKRGVVATIRNSSGADARAACGQLRGATRTSRTR